jgi:hypothetical protein
MVAAVDGAVAMTSPPTLADLIADPGELWAWSWCMDCHHNVTMSVAALLSRYVAETPFPDVWGGFRCSVSPCQEAYNSSAQRGNPRLRTGSQHAS